MTGAIGQLLSVKSRLKRDLVQRDQERKVQNGNVQMTNSTTLSGKPSRPATRYRLFKVFAARAFPDKIDHSLSWSGMQRIRIERSWSETRRWPRINYRRCTPLA